MLKEYWNDAFNDAKNDANKYSTLRRYKCRFITTNHHTFLCSHFAGAKNECKMFVRSLVNALPVANVHTFLV